jgi:transcription antitermination factor NusG
MTDWVVLNLTDKASGADPALIVRSVRSYIKTADVFVPAAVTVVGTDRVVQYVVDGYAFVRHTHQEKDYAKLCGTAYVQDVLMAPNGLGGKRLQTITDAGLAKFRDEVAKLEGPVIAPGDTVVVLTGIHKNLAGVVVDDCRDIRQLTVELALRTKNVIVSVPYGAASLLAKRIVLPQDVELMKCWLDAFEVIRLGSVLPFLMARWELLIELKAAVTRQKELLKELGL